MISMVMTNIPAFNFADESSWYIALVDSLLK